MRQLLNSISADPKCSITSSANPTRNLSPNFPKTLAKIKSGGEPQEGRKAWGVDAIDRRRQPGAPAAELSIALVYGWTRQAIDRWEPRRRLIASNATAPTELRSTIGGSGTTKLGERNPDAKTTSKP